MKVLVDGVSDEMVFVAEGREKVWVVGLGKSKSGRVMDFFGRFLAMSDCAFGTMDGVEEFFGF